ncbi:MBL fold metallo-hydrolase [Streptomyces radicis]|uniref:MBL fold metallo-hydrolase n=1 Tax=Streptomyces radicis TaxID=1750517 RepID=A0A3A9VTJ7_9ACTN|nr:MBL fold metallo-hydrolase [Streptomyces radicis]RKN03862.1 MBL fold metallo-hydrolase [Streptomyces radicis]RKN13944.1 MBL fold metallo-hydrolase [Streptomyces radicis]
MRVHHIDCGAMRPLGGRLIDDRPGLLRRGEMVTHCLLIDTGAQLVLVDTGLGTPSVDGARDWLGRGLVAAFRLGGDAGETAVARVRGLGHDPADVSDIVLTHGDGDHAGGLVDFPDANVHVFAEELRALSAPRTRLERTRYRRAHFAHRPRWIPYEDAGERWFGFEAVRALKGLPPEILLVPLAGHTRGHAGVAVDTGAGWLLHAGDSYFHRGELDATSPHCPPGIGLFQRMVESRRRERLANQRHLRELVHDHGDRVTVFSAHCADELDAFGGSRGAASA